MRLAQHLLSAFGCPTLIKSVTHKQAEWFITTLPVQAKHYII